MPQFQVISREEARARTATPSRRSQVIQEYVDFIGQLKEGQSGKLQPSPGETVATVRRRLGSAAKVSGRDLVIKRTGDEIYFWIGQPTRKRRGRTPASAK